MKVVTEELVQDFKMYLLNEEKAVSTVEKYIHDILVFISWLSGESITKEAVMKYKRELIGKLAPSSVNSVISSLNSFFVFAGMHDCKVKSLKIQKQIFANKNKELSKEEYNRLLSIAYKKKNLRLYYLMQTMCSTGIRVSELRFVTVEAVKHGQAVINGKGKMRVVILAKQLCKMLKLYIKENKIKSGCVFVTRTGKPLDRSNIWKQLKRLCQAANVEESKVFPHNLRHLFARTYYAVQKDIVRLADVLGHSNVNTTRIYTMESGEVHRRQIQKLGLLKW